MAENGCIRVGQTSSVYTLPDYIRASGRSIWKSVVLAGWIFLTPRRRGEAVSASFQHRQRCSVQRRRGALLLPLPLHKSVSRLPPLFSLYQYCQRKKTFQAIPPNFESAPLTAPIGNPRLFNQTFHLSFRVCGWGVSTYQWSFSAFTYRPSGLPAILTDGSVV